MKLVLMLLGVFFIGQCFAQNPISDEKSFEERYARNIKKSRINSVYIPKNLDEAMSELVALSTDDALEKFKKGEEELVAKRLHFGLGRWMIYNWNFYEGSRFSHYLKEKGVAHPDDQARFVIICLHRRLNDVDLGEEAQILAFQQAREKERLSKIKVLKQETRIRENDHR